MIGRKKDYVTLRELAQYGKEYHTRLIRNTNHVDSVYKDLNYYGQYYKNIAIAFWKLEEALKNKKIKFAKGMSTIGTDFEVIPRMRNAGSTAPDVLANESFFIPEINCLPKEINDKEYGKVEKTEIEYVKALFTLKNKDLVFLMSVFTSTLVNLISYIEKNYERLLDDIEEGKINGNIQLPYEMRRELEKKMSPNEKRAKELRKIFEEKTEEPLIPKIWKNMTMIATFSLGESSLYEKKLKKYSGDTILYTHPIYASGKSLIATVYDEKEKNYLLSYDSGFYEFIPIEDNNQKALSMEELEIGKLYEVVATDLSKNCLYKTKDIVRVVGYEGKVPLIRFVYKKDQLINVGGVDFFINNILNIIKQFEENSLMTISDYAICVDNSSFQPKLVLVLETENVENMTNYEEVLSDLFRTKLSNENENYDWMYRTGKIGKAMVKVINKDEYRKIRKIKTKKGIPINHEKAVRFVNYEALVS